MTPRIERRNHEVKMRTAEVVGVANVTPRMLEITLAGPELVGFRSDAPDDHVKLFFPRPGTNELVLPSPGPGGLTWPADRPKPVLRDYTPRRFDAERGELAIQFVLHGDGPATSWARNAKPGSMLGIGGPRGSFVISGDFDAYWLIGDESALPAIARRIEELPTGARVRAFVEVEDRAEEQQLASRADVAIRYLHRSSGGPSLADVVRDAALPSGHVFAFVAGESTMARAIRDQLVARGIPREQMRASGYWKRGTTGDGNVKID